MSIFPKLILLMFLSIHPMKFQKRIKEKGESNYPFLVNMWIPKNIAKKQEKPRFCDAIQLTPFTDYFFTSAKCFDYLEHDMWLEDIGISWDENVVSYSRHMSFLTRYKEEGGHFVILERFENNPLDSTSSEGKETEQYSTIDDIGKNTRKPAEFEYVTYPTGPKAPREMPNYESLPESSQFSSSTNRSQSDNPLYEVENSAEEYDKIPADLAQYAELEDLYEIKEQIQDEMKLLRSLRNKKIKLSTPDVRGATECYVLGWGTYLKHYEDLKDLEGLTLQKEVVKKLPRKMCKSSDPAHICISKNTEKRECVEDLGSPLVCERKDRRNNTLGVALVGIYTGFKNCVVAETGIFRSLSSELPWIARWAKGTPITTSGFGRRVDKQPEGRSRFSKRNMHRRGRSGSSTNTSVFKYVSFIKFLILYINCS